MPTQVKLRFFKTTSHNVTETESTIFQRLSAKLINSRIDSRIIKVHPNIEDSDEDVLSYYVQLQDNYLFGMIMRISSKKSVKAVPFDFTNLSNLRFSDLHEVEDDTHERYCTSHYYFMLKGNFLVIDLPKTMTIGRFQDFINKLLNQEEKYSYVPMLDTGEIAMNEVAKIVVRDSPSPQQEGETGKTAIKLMHRARNYILKKLVPQMPSLQSLDRRNIFSAELTIKATRPKRMELEEYNNQLSALLQPIADASNVHVYTKKGVITGERLSLTKDVEINEDEGNAFEMALMNTMKTQLNTYCFHHEN